MRAAAGSISIDPIPAVAQGDLPGGIVAFVRPGGPAAQAGLQAGDEIVSVDGHDVTGVNGYLYYTLTAVKAGTRVRVGLARGVSVEVTASKPN